MRSAGKRYTTCWINRAVASPVVQAALAAHTVFGMDTRFLDGQVFRVSLGSDYVDVGTQCDPVSSVCRAVPPGVQALVDALEALDAQELSKPECVSAFAERDL